MENQFDVIIVGGGPGGLEAALQLGRYGWRTLVVDKGKGRSSFVPCYHNILGYPEGVSGAELLQIGRKQATKYGVKINQGLVTQVKQVERSLFEVTVEAGSNYRARKIIFNTGVMDRHPQVPNVFYWAGYGIYYCPDCDGYEVLDREVVVVGEGNRPAAVAMGLLNWTSKLKVVNVDTNKTISPDWKVKLEQHRIPIYNSPLKEFVGAKRDIVEQVVLEDGTLLSCEKVFSAFGMARINSELAASLGVELQPNRHIIVNPRTKETNVPGVWAVGDVVAHSQQVTIAIGEGNQAAIWVNKRLREEGLLPR